MGCRAKIWPRAYNTASRRMLCHTLELRRNLAELCRTLSEIHHNIIELRRNLASDTAPKLSPRRTLTEIQYATPWLSYAAPCWATSNPTELLRFLAELRRSLLSYSAS